MQSDSEKATVPDASLQTTCADRSGTDCMSAEVACTLRASSRYTARFMMNLTGGWYIKPEEAAVDRTDMVQICKA